MYLSEETAKSINNICSLIGFSLLFGGALIQAIVSNCYIEPKIEKRLGVKLQYMPIWRAMPLFGYFLCRNIELIVYIWSAHFNWKFKGNNHYRIPWYCLYKTNYRIEDASKSEIVFAWVSMTNILITTGILLTGTIVTSIF